MFAFPDNLLFRFNASRSSPLPPDRQMVKECVWVTPSWIRVVEGEGASRTPSGNQKYCSVCSVQNSCFIAASRSFISVIRFVFQLWLCWCTFIRLGLERETKVYIITMITYKTLCCSDKECKWFLCELREWVLRCEWDRKLFDKSKLQIFFPLEDTKSSRPHCNFMR